jgi:hypothetical protein
VFYYVPSKEEGGEAKVLVDACGGEEDGTMGEFETRKLWGTVAKGIRTGDFDLASKEKAKIEVSSLSFSVFPSFSPSNHSFHPPFPFVLFHLRLSWKFQTLCRVWMLTRGPFSSCRTNKGREGETRPLRGRHGR